MANNCLNVIYCEDTYVDICEIVKPFINVKNGIGLYLDFNKILAIEEEDLETFLARKKEMLDKESPEGVKIFELLSHPIRKGVWSRHTNSYFLELPQKNEAGDWSITHNGFPCVSYCTANTPNSRIVYELASLTKTNISLYAVDEGMGFEFEYKAYADGREPYSHWKNFTKEEMEAIWLNADCGKDPVARLM